MPGASPFPPCDNPKCPHHHYTSSGGEGAQSTQLRTTDLNSCPECHYHHPHLGELMLRDILWPGSGRMRIQPHVGWESCFVCTGPLSQNLSSPSCCPAPSSAQTSDRLSWWRACMHGRAHSFTHWHTNFSSATCIEALFAVFIVWMQHLCTCKGHLVLWQSTRFPTARLCIWNLFTVTKYKSTCRHPILCEVQEAPFVLVLKI